MRLMSIRQYLGQIILFVTVFSVFFLAVFKIYWFDPHIEMETEQRQFQVADVLSHQVKIYLTTPVVQMKSVVAQFKDFHSNWATLEQVLNAQAGASDALEVAYAVDQTGTVRALGLPQYQEQRRKDLQHLDLSLNPLFLRTLQSKKMVWSEVFLSTVNQELSIGFSIPAEKWAFIGEVSLEKLRTHLQKIAGRADHLVLILDAKGQVLFDQHGKYFNQQVNISNIPAVDEAIHTKKSISRKFNFDNMEMQGVLSPIESTSWFLVYAEPVSFANSASHSISMATIACFLATLLVGIILVLILSKKMSRQFTDLAERALRVASGESDVEWPEFLVAEFSQLSESIQHTARQLFERERQLNVLMGNLPGTVYRARNDNIPEVGFMSQGSLRLTGYRSDELQCENMLGYRLLIHRDDIAHVNQSTRQCIDENKPWQVTYRILTKGGGVKWVCDYGQAFCDESSGVTYREGFIADVTERKRSEEELAESEVRLRTVLGNLPVVLAVVDKEGIYTMCEGTGLKKIGLTPGQIVGKSLFSRYRNFPEILADFRRCLSGESIHNQAHIYDNWYEIIYEPVIESDGKISGAMIVSFDISFRKNAENKLLRLSSLLKSTQSLARVGAWELDLLTNELYWSDETYHIYEVSPKDFIPTVENTLSFYIPESRMKIATAIQKAIDTGRSYDMHLSLITAQGNQREVHATCEVIEDNGKTIRIIGALQDITGYKLIEAELRTHKLHLEELVEQRTLELVVARDAAERATQAKSNFLANTSHEIRTPINTVVGLTRLALKTELSPKQKGYLEKVNISANLLLGLINDILDFSKIEAGRLELVKAEFSLADVLQKVSTVTVQKAHDKDIEYLLHISPDADKILIGDPMRLSQVLINLCGNAVKFTERGEVILSVVSVPNTRQDQVTLQFSVRDSGIGISKNELESLFKPFNQVDSSNTRRFGGTGLGLAISQQLVEMMGGRICVESTPGQGSEFKFTANFNTLAENSSSQSYQALEIQGLKALVVDESIYSRDIHSALLSSFGYDVTSAASLDEASDLLRSANSRAYDFVLLDWKLLQEKEWQLDTLKSINVMQSPRIILLITDAHAEKQQKMLTLVDGFVSKPVLASPLLDTIMTTFGRHRSISPAAAKHTNLIEQAHKSLHGRCVLLVEDNEFNQEVACELLNEIGIVTTIATNGQEAVYLAMHQPFDLVLMDIQMPIMDGFAATHRMRCEPQLHGLPIVAMTAHAMVDEQQRCVAAGMNDFLSKPVDPDNLYTVLMRWIKPVIDNAQVNEIEPASVNQSSRLPASIAGISIAKGLLHSGGKTDFYLKMLKRFLQTKKDEARKIREQIEQGDLASAHRTVHNLKSVSAHIGAEVLSAAAWALEKTLHSGAIEHMETQQAEVAEQLMIVIQGLDVSLNELPQFAPATTKHAPMDIPGQLQKLAGLLKQDIGKALKLERELRPVLEDGPLSREYAQFCQRLKSFDTDAAAEALHILIAALAVEAGVS